MLVQKDNPVGIDKRIAYIQKILHDQLVNRFSWPDDYYYAYERVYLNQKEGQRIPELYVGSSDPKDNEYREIYFNDNNIAESYFVVEDNRTIEDGLYRASVGIIFQVNLEDLFPTIEHRADEECHRQVEVALYECAPEIAGLNTLITGLSVYAGLDTRTIQETDMHPCHVFRYNFDIHYVYNC